MARRSHARLETPSRPRPAAYQELADLTYAITLINVWNRLGVAFQPDLPPAKTKEPA